MTVPASTKEPVPATRMPTSGSSGIGMGAVSAAKAAPASDGVMNGTPEGIGEDTPSADPALVGGE